MNHWANRIRAAFPAAGHDLDDDVVEELAEHARGMYEARRAEGFSQAEADRLVEDQLQRWQADGLRLRRASRQPAQVVPPAATATTWLTGALQDVRYAARLLRRQPRFALLAGATMALGIAAATILVSVTYAVLVKPLPWVQADRLILLKETRGGHPPRFNAFSNATYLAWGSDPATIE